jgi:hypothetical protein
MCKICDRLNQWVCDCGYINRIGSKCQTCGGVRSGDEVGIMVETGFDDSGPNRAARRRGTGFGLR